VDRAIFTSESQERESRVRGGRYDSIVVVVVVVVVVVRYPFHFGGG